MMSTGMRETSFAASRSRGPQLRPLGDRPRREPLWGTNAAFFTDVGLFLFGLGGLYNVSIIGSVPGYEILLLPLLPVMLFLHGKRAFSRQFIFFYILVGSWLLGTLIADTYNDIAFFNRAKGTARVVFFALDFMALAIFINNKTRRFIVFALSIAAMRFFGSLQFTDFPLKWKFGLSHSVTMIVLLLSARFYSRQKYGVCISIFLLLAALNFYYGYRSQLLILIVSAILSVPVFEIGRSRLNQAGSKQSMGRSLILLAVAFGAANLLNVAIKYGAQRGIFDESTNGKFQAQASGDYGVLVGGRPETLVAIQAIRDNPIIGFGSFPYGEKYRQMQQDIQYEHGYSESDEPEEVDYPVIPSHSHLTMAGIEGGILGGICWICIFIQVFRSTLRLSAIRSPLAPLYRYLLVSFLWDILYSPFGSVNRMLAAYFILLSVFVLRNYPKDTAKRIMPSQAEAGRWKPIRLKQVARLLPGSLTTNHL